MLQRACRARAGQLQAPALPFSVDAAQSGHEAGADFTLLAASCQLSCSVQVHQHHADLDVLVAGAVDLSDDRVSVCSQVTGFAAGGRHGKVRYALY